MTTLSYSRSAETAVRMQRVGGWSADPGFGIYVHIPFCRHRCHYCDFNTYEGLDTLHSEYVDALVDEIARWSGDAPPATSVFFGGGTPTLLAPRDLGRILTAIEARFGIASNAEVTTEANPETVDQRAFEELLVVGFNRVSIGVQSAVPHVLRGLGRTHSPEIALDAIGAAHSAGFGDVNADLIFGSPWEAASDWTTSLAAVIAAAPDHVSAYALTVEEGTPLHTLVRTGRVSDVDPDIQAERFQVARELLGAAGYDRYEVSNWARRGHASKHNVLYWSAGNYLGFGAGAHSHVNGHRWWTTRLPRDYIGLVAERSSTSAGEERLDPSERGGEALMLGLRLASGIETALFSQRFGIEILDGRGPLLESLGSQGMLEITHERIRLTERGTLLANDVLCRLL
jgi:oxygen-independent coproporphyrinogen-3 oxidase